MHDPMSVAFEIKYPWKSDRNSLSPNGWRRSFITIWHVDPELGSHQTGLRSDDSCGWHTPPITPDERAKIRKIGEEMYSTIFEKRCRTQEGATYAYICYEPSAYDAIYWAWRRIKREDTKHIWQFGKEKNFLSAGELEAIYMLASRPSDNLQSTVGEVVDRETCGSFFLSVYRAYRRYNRPWWDYPRWHFWHWRFQVHPWQALRRWLLTRCARCGKRFAYGESPVSHSWHNERPKFMQGERGLYHMDCSGHHVAEANLRAVDPQGTA